MVRNSQGMSQYQDIQHPITFGSVALACQWLGTPVFLKSSLLDLARKESQFAKDRLTIG